MATGINFRQTAGYVTDGADDTYCLGEAYPTTRGGLTFGFASSVAADMRNRATSVDARLAGGFGKANATGTVDFRVDLPAAGQYDISLGLGDANNAQNHRVIIKDAATTVATINVATAIATWADATGATYEFSPAWVAGQTAVRLTFASTTLILTLGGHASATLSTFLAHLRVVAVAPSSALSGAVTLDNVVAAGTLADAGSSSLTGGPTLADVLAAGTLGTAPGVVTTQPFRTPVTGLLLAGLTVPKLALIRVSDMAPVATLFDQVTSGAGVLTITHAGLVPGLDYIVVSCNADGTAWGAEVCRAA